MEKIRFMTSLLTFYLKGEIGKNENFVMLKIPNTIFGIIPLGAHTESIPINQISLVGSSFHLLVGRLFLGLIAALIGLSVIGSSFIFGIIMILVGVLTVINSFQTVFAIDLTSGRRIVLFFVIFEKSKAGLAEQEINKLISSRMDDTNTRQQTDRVVDAINRK